MVSLDRNTCIAIDVFRYFMHRRICQTPCQTLELVLAHCQLGTVALLSNRVTLFIRFVCSGTKSNITIQHLVWLVEKRKVKGNFAGCRSRPSRVYNVLLTPFLDFPPFAYPSYQAHPWEAQAANQYLPMTFFFMFIFEFWIFLFFSYDFSPAFYPLPRVAPDNFSVVQQK